MDIVERLRSVGGIEGTTRWYINPDGPEAADEIERLRGQVFQFKNATPQILSSHNNIVKNYVTNTELILSEVREDNKRLREILHFENRQHLEHAEIQHAEIERLREALNKISRVNADIPEIKQQLLWCARTARAALKGDE